MRHSHPEAFRDVQPGFYFPRRRGGQGGEPIDFNGGVNSGMTVGSVHSKTGPSNLYKLNVSSF